MEFDFFDIISSVKVAIFKTDKWLLLVLFALISYKLFSSWIVSRKKVPPGPWGLPLVGCLPFLGPEPHKTLQSMTAKYGNLIGVQLGANFTVVLNEYKLAKEVLNHPAALERSLFVFAHIPENGMLTAKGEPWAVQRRFCMGAARDLGLGRGLWEGFISAEVANFIRYLRDTDGRPTDVSHKLSSSITSNIISLLIGRLLGDNEMDKVNLSASYSELTFQYTSPISPATLIPGFRKMLEIFRIAGYDRIPVVTNRFFEFLKKEISRHKISPDMQNVKDFISLYLEKLNNNEHEKDSHDSFSERMLLGNLSTLFLGSSDTINTSLTHLIRLVAKHQDIQEKVYQELANEIGIKNEVSYADKDRIPYTFAVILELQRYTTIAPFPIPRRANKDFEINGYVIPEGCDIATNVWAIHHDPNYWEQPDLFMPERFLTKNGDKVNSNPPGFIAFSTGKRDCPGRTVAEMEILAYFTEIIKHFRVTAEPGKDVRFEVIRGLTQNLKPQKLCFLKRNSEI